MKRYFWLLLAVLLSQTVSFAQTSVAETGAAKTVQPSQILTVAPPDQPISPEVRIPAGTPIEVEVAYTVNSLDVKAGERISFRVLIPIMIEGVTVVEKDALVTARITQAKRGGHWGKAGKLAWSMEDVVAVDNTRIRLAPETASRSDKLWSLETKSSNSETKMGGGSVKGTSHKGEVTTRTIVAAAIFPPLAPLALMHGFRRGENAILREGRRFVVAIAKETTVKVDKVAGRVAEN